MQTLFIIPGTCSFGSIVALEWINQPYQIGLTTPEIRAGKSFRAVNPLGKVGALKDGNTLVYENLAILLYLVDKNPQSKIAIPLNTEARINAYKWLSYLSSTYHVAFGAMFHPENYVDAPDVDKFKVKITKRINDSLAYINGFLEHNNYFISNDPTVVDAQAYGLLRWSERSGFLSAYPHVDAFLQRMNKLQAVQNALNIEQGNTQQLENSSFGGYYDFSE